MRGEERKVTVDGVMSWLGRWVLPVVGIILLGRAAQLVLGLATTPGPSQVPVSAAGAEAMIAGFALFTSAVTWVLHRRGRQ